MKVSKIICDRCKKEIETGSYPSTPFKEGWKDIEIKLSQYNTKTFTFCPNCMNELGLIDKNTGAVEKISDPSIQQKVFDLLYEITNIVIDERQ